MSKVMDKIKKRRKFISIAEKMNILDCLEKGERPSFIAKTLNLNEATIRTIQKNENKIRSTVSAGSFISQKNTARTRSVLIEKMEKALILWIEDSNYKNIPIDRSVIQKQALTIYNNLKITEQSSSDDQQSSHGFAASRGWFENFKKRFSLHNIKTQEENVSADIESANKCTSEFAEITKNDAYIPEQVFNADEKGMYWGEKLLNQTNISKSEKHAKGLKLAKDRISLLLSCNSSGDFTIKPLLTNRSLHHRELVEMLDEPTTINESESSCSEAAACFTLKTIDEGLGLANKLEHFFVQNDPIMERGKKFKRELQNILTPYHEIRKDLYAKSRQTLITDFLKAKSAETPESSDDENSQPISKMSRKYRIVNDSDDD